MPHHHDTAGWAQENGYDYHAETQGAISKEARSLAVFRKAERFRDHVQGIHRNRPFEILDFEKQTQEGDMYGSVWHTVILIPTTGLDLPNFDLVPRRETGGMNFLGIKGLELKLSATATIDERRMVHAFDKNYSLFGGGAFDALEASIKSAPHRVPSLAEMASICKPSVLSFLSIAVTGYIEVRDGYVAICAPKTRIITGPFSDTILRGRERESLLSVTNDLLDVLESSAREAPLRALTLENTFRPAQFLGTLIGSALGFFVGLIMSIVLFFMLDSKYLLLIPLPIFGGIVLGRFIGNRLMRAK